MRKMSTLLGSNLSVQCLCIDKIGWAQSTSVRNDILTRHCCHQRARFERGTADMRQKYYLFHTQQLRCHGRLMLKHVEPSPGDRSRRESRNEGLLIDNRTTG